MSLRSLALEHAGPARGELAALPDLDATLRARLAEARRTWSDMDLDEAVFVRHLVERLPASGAAEALSTWFAADLYVACGVVAGRPRALAIFEHHFLARACRTRAGDAVDADELRQALRTRLLVGAAGEPPRLASYTGRGPLVAWLKVIVARTLVDARRVVREEVTFDREAPGIAAGLDPERALLQRRYAEPFARAFEEAVRALPARESNLLRLTGTGGMSTAAVATLYRVSERTAQRWLADLRQQVLEATHRRLAATLGASASEVASLYAVVASALDVRLPRVRRGG